MISSREVRFVNRPRGWPKPEDFEFAHVSLAPPEEGEVLVKNRYMSVDPYMRERLHDLNNYLDAFQVGQALEGLAIGEVVASRSSELAVGDAVSSMLGWREYFVAKPKDMRKVDHRFQPLSGHLGVLGTAGLTAWAGLNLVDVQAKDRVLISDAAGAMGSVAGQLAKLRGCYVVGIAGSMRDVSMLLGLGFDAAFNHREGDLSGQLKLAAPDGIDVYFDSVGGLHLEVALAAMRPYGRIVACSAASSAREAPWQGPRNFSPIVAKRLTVKGYLLSDLLDLVPDFIAAVGDHYREGRLRTREIVVEGFEHAPQAFIDLLRDGDVGVKVVKFV